MAKKSTTEEFISKAKILYGNKYGYDEVVYINSTTKVRVHCAEHGAWDITPTNLLNKKGCPACGRNKLADAFRSTVEDFVEVAKKVHGEGTYDYSLVEYKGNKTHVKIVCPTHGVWEQLPSNHYRHGCPSCAAEQRGEKQRTDQEQFIKELRDIHGDRYDYSLVKYQGLSRRIKIVCKEHGVFSMFANVHKGSAFRKGADCPKCAKHGYNPSLPGILYVLTDGDAITKIGITNKSLKRRLYSVSKTSGKTFSVTTTFSFEDGSIPDRVETDLLRELRLTHNQPDERFDGRTECFLHCDHSTLLDRIEELIALHTLTSDTKEQHSSPIAAQAA